MYKIFKKLFMPVTIISILIIAAYLWPFICTLRKSFSDADTYYNDNFQWFIKMSFSNYRTLFRQSWFIDSLKVTCLRIVWGVCFGLSANVITAWVLSQKELVFRKTITGLFIIPFFLYTGVSTRYILINNLNLTESFHIYWLTWGVSPVYMLVLRNYIRRIPQELTDTVLMEGGKDCTAFMKVVLPHCKPIIVALALFLAVDHWNAFTDTIIYAARIRKNTNIYMTQEDFPTPPLAYQVHTFYYYSHTGINPFKLYINRRLPGSHYRGIYNALLIFFMIPPFLLTHLLTRFLFRFTSGEYIRAAIQHQ